MKFPTNKENTFLRFYEFIETLSEGDLSDLISNLDSGVSVNSLDCSVKNSNEKGVLKTSCISNGVFYPSENKKILDKDLVRAKQLVKAETIIVSRMNTPLLVGEIGFVPSDLDNLYLPDRLWTAEIMHGHNAKWLSYYLISPKVKRILKNIATGTSGSMKNISKPNFLKISVSFPQEKEQQKIANFLSSVDKKIQQLTEKQLLLQQYKKGIMQKLFSQDIRFKNEQGKDFPGWEEKALAEALTPRIREVKKPSEKYLAIGIRSHMKGTFQKPESDPDDIAMEKLFVVKENDLVVNITFAWEGAIAIVKPEDDGGLVSHRFPAYTFKKDQATHEFFRHIITQKRFKYMLDVISPGGAGRNRVLSKKEFLKLKWTLPSVAEQNKIASFLGELDKKIALTNKQIEQTKTFKKGLLQQMFV